MKTRSRFVSNSSTTSFCILGDSFQSDVVDNLENRTGLDDHHLYQDSDVLAVGISLEHIATWKDGNGTYNEFVEEVKRRLAAAGLKPENIHIMEGGWYDG
jgi:hypothetical protein